jgi:hypothetical protein
MERTEEHTQYDNLITVLRSSDKVQGVLWDSEFLNKYAYIWVCVLSTRRDLTSFSHS